MHGRQSGHVRRFLHSCTPQYSAATATAVKPPPDSLSKWSRPQTNSTELQPSSQATPPGLNKWARPAQSAPASSPVRQPPDSRLPNKDGKSAETYLPNVGRWGRQNTNEPARKSILSDFDVSNSKSPFSTPLDLRQRAQSLDKLLAQTPQFPVPVKKTQLQVNKTQFPVNPPSHISPEERNSRSNKVSLDRDRAPHLNAKRDSVNTHQGKLRSVRVEARDRQLERELQPGSNVDRKNVYRDVRTRESYVEDVGLSDDRKVGVRYRRGQRESFKSRGSVIERLRLGESVEIPKHSRISEDRIEMTAAKTTKRNMVIQPVNADVTIPSVVSVGNLSRLLGVRLETLRNVMRRNDMEEQSSYDHLLSADDASLLAMEFNRNPIFDDQAAFDIYALPPHLDPSSLPRRPPVVTIMGHVDHGKTTLLDTLRSSSVAKGEAGGITQHIGAFSVPVPSAATLLDIPPTITFLDTPGHAAFSAMRARGAQVTDIIVLVVAADDGVMPQTREVINLIKKDKVGVVVAINKVDKPGANIQNVHNALWAEGIEIEAMGGDVPAVEVSGLTGLGLEELVDTISLLAEMQEIRAETDGPAHGYVLESNVVKGFGNTATVLLLRGTLTPSSYIISGTTYAKIRKLTDATGMTVKAALPGSAVTVSGWKELPSAGDEVLQGKEHEVKRAVGNRLRKASLEATLGDAEAINALRRQDREEREKKVVAESVPTIVNTEGPKELRLVIKGDVSGSIEALAAAVESIGNKHAMTKVISTGVGEVSESDIMFAAAAKATVIAFSVNVSRIADQKATQNSVPIFSSKIIYNVLDEIKERIIELLPPVIETRVTGEANVLQLFDINGKRRSLFKVAGCRVSNGQIEKDKLVKVLRNGETIHKGTLSTLRILKRDVTEVKKGLECGISLTNFSDIREGDFLQFYQEIEKPGRL
ncbi:hypothetical protein EW145_g396 [Phellinidium pouzarii]|uniref:Translation initiation factor IF-2, mitochondrial n=1 Tax=Phellinidium pouzarii TaxID=167371 RepID=A0A4S4LIQ4_9AGAM|nr:hypothetical protein EW145_g396 [Phellinidium pouzarii]